MSMSAGCFAAAAEDLVNQPSQAGGSTEEATTTDASASDDTPSTADVVMKGFIPDLQRQQMVQDAVSAAKKAEEKAAAKSKLATPKPVTAAKSTTSESARSTSMTTALKPLKTTAATAEEAKEAADRANGILPSKPANGSGKTVVKIESGKTSIPPTGSGKSIVPPAIALDNKPENPKKSPARADTATASTSEKKTVVEDVPVAPGKTLGIKKTVTEDQASATDSDNGEVVTGSAAGVKGYLSVSGRVVSTQMGKNGRLKVLVNSPTYGLVEANVEPHIGMRVPLAGASITVHGKKIGGGEKSIVMRADEITGSSGAVPVYERRVVRRVPGPMVGGPFPGPMYMRPGPPPPYF